jgi:hypothetical protein
MNGLGFQPTTAFVSRSTTFRSSSGSKPNDHEIEAAGRMFHGLEILLAKRLKYCLTRAEQVHVRGKSGGLIGHE